MTTINQLKGHILRAAHSAKEGHVASAFSVLDILYVIYQNINVDPTRPKLASRDFVFLSKGHASLGLYAVLAERGFFPMADLAQYCSLDSHLGGHPHRKLVPGVEASTGSLGHGFPMSIGVAMSLSHDLENNHVHCIVGDGELNEGSMWEAALLAAHHRLNNITLWVDYNQSNDRAIMLHSLADKFEAFRWSVHSVQGHNHKALAWAAKERAGRPLAMICNTVKGKGIQAMELEPHAWHHRTPNAAELAQFLKELE